MRLQLEHLDARGLDLQLGRDDRRAVISTASGLRGQLVQDGERLALDDVQLDRAELATLALGFTRTTVAADAPVALESLQGRAERKGNHLRLELRGARASCAQLTVRVGELEIRGGVELTGLRLKIDGRDGVVFTDRIVLERVSLALGSVRLALDRIVGEHVAVGWGGAGVRVEARSIDLASGSLDIVFPEAKPAAAASTPRSRPVSREDLLALLDGLAGDLNVDLTLDMAVPVLGSRRATHQFRIPIEHGALDYRKLESDLSALEDSLLDFAVRDGGLVLERGIPLLPTRGRGKPIVRWDLDAADLELAEARRIRLAVLPNFTMVASGNGDGGATPDKPSRVALRELALDNLAARLKLELDTPPARLPLQRIEELAVTGAIHHAPDAPPREGRVQARLAGVELGRTALSLGRLQLALEHLALDHAEPIEITFAGLAPRTICGALRGLAITDLELAPAASPPLHEPAFESRVGPG